MASPGSNASFCRRNSKLETFLKRNAHRDVHERIRYYEACVIVSEELDKVFMHVVLTDDCVYLTEYHPKKLLRALNFSLILHIELINDLPDFLRGKNQEQSLHIRIVHTRLKERAKPQPAAKPCQQEHTHSLGLFDSCTFTSLYLCSRDAEDEGKFDSSRKSSVLTRLKQKAAKERKKKKEDEGKNEAELHLYAVMTSSQIYVRLQRSWNSYIMKSTLMLSPCTLSSFPSSKKHSLKPKISWERKCQLFSQLSGELLQEVLSLEGLYLLVQELCTAARQNPAVKTLFWRSPELYSFLVKTLTDSLQLSEDKLHYADRLLLSMLVVQTIGLMFGETEKEVSHFSTITSKQGSVTADLLLVLVCDPELKSNNCDPVSHAESDSPLSPSQAVLLYQRCCLLLTCMQHNTSVKTYLITELREEFRYYVRQSKLDKKLPSHYPISRPAKHLLLQLLSLVLDRP
ncbi:hypothetical protein Baya_9596 [Bagarius yarrelli]|uniref:Uncharacterized protein n=1 Tax=Bagarius yarrelli TaxID=175774 RepID=A0A556UXN3_BAGYA|nr:hypothetical protein Baya_9596 [Bagarius yarrelli]